ncbi:hypothetical protein LCGC14_0320430 [marine sediment metagenome]|uniref:Uncharacterized protein n=1 Tax=marine sediment metagenome TaxID=412755 RepID=A0A0F9TJP6_9ZZZZ
MSQTVEEALRGMWEDLQDNANPMAMNYVKGAIAFAGYTGVLNEEQVELWMRRIETCPIGDHENDPRAWCAYCGKLPPRPEDPDNDTRRTTA